MKRSTLYLLGIIITIIVGIYFYINCCSYCSPMVQQQEEAKQEVAPTPAPPKASSYPFALSDGDFNYETQDNYNFNRSSPRFLEPVSENVTRGISPGLKDYLATHKDKVLTLTGYYQSDEDNNTAFPNLGLARANSVKNHLTSLEIPSSQIDIQGKLMGDMVADGNIFKGPIAYAFSEKSGNDDDEIKALYEKITSDPLVLYFDTAEASINPSEEQRQKIADIVRYLDKVENAKCNIVGYTDSKGGRQTNLRLGQGRADFAKAYLVQNGIAADRVATTSKGPNDPIASNATEEGRAKNRRTVISIK
ncbi:cell envelope biogenesis protein OmpA [Zobellia sp. OII3]|uniref:OmpA family protein n=1 Tax=Zobellia sp. OII3 TaxID=2034520 RepID=UPI000B52A6DB|nr:OmpA family protein [Zobellia sp. OII3]OWW26592.1 cell envelope biogenesis protein OmpA [Zobellia sp. OII3]